MTQTARWLRGVWLVLGCWACVACSKPRDENQEPPEEAANARQRPLAQLAYAWKSDGRATFKLKTKGLLLNGSLGGLRGQLSLDPENIVRSRARIELDLTTLQVASADEDSLSDRYSAEARAWFGLGQAVPEADRKARRWLSFELTALKQPSASRPTDAKVSSRRSTPSGYEIHRIHAVAEGELLLHGFRVQQTAPVRLDFTYASPLTRNSAAESVRVQSLSPIRVSLLAHAILPRTEAGIVVSEKAKELGKTIDSEALVEFDFQAVRISR